MKMKYLCLAIYLAWSGVAVAETAQQASAVSVVVAKSDDELREKEIELKAQEKSQAMMEKYLELHEKTITGQQKSIDWWLAALGLIIALAGAAQFLFLRGKQKEWEEERDKLRDEIKQELNSAKNITADIEKLRDKSEDYADEISQMHKMKFALPNENLSAEQIEQNQAGVEAAEKLADNREIPLIEQLRVQAILLLDSAKTSQQYHDYEKAFHAWYGVWLQDENDASVCFNLGLIAQNLYKKGTREQQLYWQPEIEKWYGKALQIKPDFHEAAYNWGNALDNEAQVLQQENKLPEAYEKWQQAGQRYQQALQIKPDKHTAVTNWGLALSKEAQALQQENKLSEAYEKWQQAGQLYQKALQIEPNDDKAAYNWGLTLSYEAEALQQENRLPEAYEKWQKVGQCYQQALQIKPDCHEAAYNWGNALNNEAEALQQENRLPEAYEKWQHSGQRYEQALQIKPDFHEAANNWGLTLSYEAEALQQENRLPEAYEKWQQAGQCYQQALQIKPDFHEAANNWGNALSDEAEVLQQASKFPEAYAKWQQAGQCYQRALQIKPDFYKAADNWVICLLQMYQAMKTGNPDMAIKSFQQAKQIAHDFLAKYPQYAPEFAYNRACLFALENNLPQAIEQLKLSQQADNFPNKAHILQDKDLANIRETPEFQAWLKEAFPDTE